jgi:NAD(P) transhydrogenase subunit alpha
MHSLGRLAVLTPALVLAWGVALAEASPAVQAPANDSTATPDPAAAVRLESPTTLDGEAKDDGQVNTQALIASLTIFVLAVFVGFEVITKVPPTLHTPLMSGSNAISGITLVGALLSAGAGEGGLATILGMVAVALATVNVVGGFLVTHRMLAMFRKK